MEVRNHQHYALDENEKHVHIKEAVSHKVYYCINCHEPVVPVKGETGREYHFRHKQSNPSCSWESYLHQLAKKRIYEWLQNYDVKLVVGTSCKKIKNGECIFADKQTCRGADGVYHLKEYFTIEGMEEEHENLVPDILLKLKGNNPKPLFVEICVTHPCSKEKINSGIRIIEFSIKSEHDIKKIVSSDTIISNPNDGKVKYYNFSRGFAESSGEQLIGVFTLYKSGKSIVKQCKCNEINNRQAGLCQIFFPEFYRCQAGIDVWGLLKALEKGIEFKNCFLCKFSVWNDVHNAYICKLYKRYGHKPACRDNEPKTCHHYIFDSQNQYKHSGGQKPDIGNNYIFKDYTKNS